ncbi:MAG: hypothetical protein K2X27_06060, partial [Candidatus Obscuribacterales bacterium]|nr:hypothetical protein [Candidatus Obscuribacterales bacterium]
MKKDLSKLLALTLTLSSSLSFEDAAGAANSRSRASGKVDETGCRSCVSQAASLFASNQLDRAVASLREWSPKCAKNAQLHLLLSTILIRQGPKFAAEAQKEAALACAAQADNQAAHLQYAMSLFAAENYAQAAAEFENVTNLNPASYEAWSALADLYKRLRRDDDAVKAENKAANLEPGTQAVKLSVLQNLKRSGKIQAARKELKKLLDSNELSPEFEQSLANEALQLGAYDEAIAAGRQVMKAYPNSSGPQNCLFLAEFLKQDYKG